ncbi:MAG: ImmA/IrrE family metallo-endopeptidase [Oscillospiraceae bacterium]|jgi:Zn-dependent peptidase ImmA (M78 family)|nr:ImmA/IrrE family metallo-endopeptidase [Oscillospiraceae bacterium]
MQFTAAHELGHAVLHPKSNTPFLREHTLFSVNKLETEANRFAVSLLYSDDDMSELQECSLDQIACAMGVNRELAEYRVKNTLCFK